MIWILTVVASLVNAFLYRFGGCSKEEGKQKYPWAPEWMFASWVRDVGVSLVTLGWLAACYPQAAVWVYPVTFGASWGALSTYWDFLWGYDNFWMHGFMIGLAKFSFAICTGLWIGFAVHCVVLALVMGLVSYFSSNVDFEELGRGAATGTTLPLMLI